MRDGKFYVTALLRAVGILLLAAVIAFIVFTAIAIGADSEPHMKTKLCGPDETHCTDVADFSGVKRARVETILSGSAVTIPGGIGDRHYAYLLKSGSADLRVNGSGTPQVFETGPDGTKDIYVEQMRCFGGCSNFKYEQFFCKNAALTNGVGIEIRSENSVLTFEPLKVTEDWKNVFSYPRSDSFRIDIQSGGDQFMAIFQPTAPFPLKKTGTYGTDDYVKITINDDLTGPSGGNLNEFKCAIVGFKRLP